jgi:hypothetical protein
MRVASIFGLGVLSMLFAAPAEALTITNSDPDSHTITVKVGGDSSELTIEPQTEVDPPCDKGCTVELESGEQYEMQGGEQASIEDGVLFVDAAPGIGDDDQPANADSGAKASPGAPPADATPEKQ